MLGSFVIFQRTRTNIAKKSYIFVSFQGGWGESGLPSPFPSRENLDSFNTLDDEILLVFDVIAFFLGVHVWQTSYQKTHGVQWLSGRVLDSRPRGTGFEPHRRHSPHVSKTHLS